MLKISPMASYAPIFAQTKINNSNSTPIITRKNKLDSVHFSRKIPQTLTVTTEIKGLTKEIFEHIVKNAKEANIEYNEDAQIKLRQKLAAISQAAEEGRLICLRNKKGEVVATCGLKYTNLAQNGDKRIHGELFGVYIDKNHQKQGIGNFLMRKILKLAAKDDCQDIILLARNPVAQKMYKKFGFQELTTPDKYNRVKFILFMNNSLGRKINRSPQY